LGFIQLFAKFVFFISLKQLIFIIHFLFTNTKSVDIYLIGFVCVDVFEKRGSKEVNMDLV